MKVFAKIRVTSKVFVTVHKHLLKLLLESFSKFPKVSDIWKWKKMLQNHFIGNWWQNQKRVLVSNH